MNERRVAKFLEGHFADGKREPQEAVAEAVSEVMRRFHLPERDASGLELDFLVESYLKLRHVSQITASGWRK